jgi:deazaflavin-dependent oxidoreductase (nitroreductase family)
VEAAAAGTLAVLLGLLGFGPGVPASFAKLRLATIASTAQWLGIIEVSGRRNATRKPGRIAAVLLRVPAQLYDWHAGWLLGGRFLRLTHRGRKSGRRYHTVLEVIATDKAAEEVVVMAGFGRSSDWFQNLQTAPADEIAIGGRRYRPQHRILDETEASDLLADFERRNRIIAPIVRRALGWMAGWPYDGSYAARAQLVQQLPMVGFRPLRDTSRRCVP